MNAQQYSLAFVAATALKRPFPAVSEAGDLGIDAAMDQEFQKAADEGFERARAEKNQRVTYVVGFGVAAVLGALVATYGFGRRRPRK